MKKVILTVVYFGTALWTFGQGAEDDYVISKGRYFTTLTFSLNQRQAENEDQLLRFVIDQDRLNYRIVGSGGYAIKDNLTVGLGVGYGRQREEITFEDENGEEVTTKRLQQGLSVVPTFRNYVSLGEGKLQILVQTELGFTFGESLQRNFSANEVDKIEGNFFEGRLGVSPGVVLFFDRHWAFETTVGLAGLSVRVEEEVTNDMEDDKQRVVQSGIDLQLNLLQLNLGVAYYF
jgi:hypothetical protein